MHRSNYVVNNMKGRTVNLNSILSLSSGYSFRGKIKHIHNGGVRVIQLKDFENNYSSLGGDCVLVDSEKIKSRYYLEDEDILFISKGTNNYALVYNTIDDIPTIASSALFVLRVNRELANPYYIAWYINQIKVQNYFNTKKVGTYITSINKAALEATPIVLPSLELQDKIAYIASLHKQEIALNQQIITLKNKLTTTQLLNTL